jgi:DNA-binding GntR family transcriptional regulator
MWVIEQATRCSTLSEYKGNRVLELAIETVELSEGPLHLKMWRSIQDRIVSADWPPLFQFPSEPELAHQFNVGRMIVRQSIETLLEKGFLYRLSWGVQCIEARIPDSEGTAVLGMPERSALLVVRRTTFLDDVTPPNSAKPVIGATSKSTP